MNPRTARWSERAGLAVPEHQQPGANRPAIMVGELQNERRGKRYRLSSDISISDLDTSHSTARYQISNGGRRFQINDSALRLLEYLREPKTVEEIQKFLADTPFRTGDVREVTAFVEGFLLEKKIIIDCDGKEDEKASEPAKKSRWVGLLFRLPLFSQASLLPITRHLQHLFAPAAVAVGLLLIVLAHGIFFKLHQSLQGASLSALSMSGWSLLLGLVYLGTFIHELGHASACLRHGARHDEIGIGLYFIYPVFYCNVTDCWSLSRYRRAVVDAGGIYFQLIFGAVCCLLWWKFRQEVLAFVVYSTIAGVVLNLNPFLRFDGYWLVTDLTGLPSIHNACKELTKYIYMRMAGKPWKERPPEIFDIPRAVRWVVVIYAVLSGLFTIYITWRISVVFLPAAYHSFMRDVPLLVAELQHREFNAAFIGMLLRLLFLALSCWGLARTTVYFMSKLMRRVWPRSSQ